MSQIYVHNISKSYNYYEHRGIFKRMRKKKQAVSGIGFEVNHGEIMGLIGANGAGKTTIIKMVAGVLAPDGGTILVNDENPFIRSKSYRNIVSIILGQRGKLHPDMTILESASLYGSMYNLNEKESLNRVFQLARMLSLSTDDLTKQARSLSLGQRMKGEICISFINNPQIVFLDEPTLGLDYPSAKTIRVFLKKYCTEHGASMILTSHNLSDIAETCSKLLIINDGKSVYYGTLADLPNQFAQNAKITCNISDPNISNVLNTYFPNISIHDENIAISCHTSEIDMILNQLFSLGEIRDLRIEETPFEAIIEGILKDG